MEPSLKYSYFFSLLNDHDVNYFIGNTTTTTCAIFIY